MQASCVQEGEEMKQHKIHIVNRDHQDKEKTSEQQAGDDKKKTLEIPADECLGAVLDWLDPRWNEFV